MENAQWSLVGIWANTPIAHIYDVPEFSECAEIQSGNGVTLIEETPQIQALNAYYLAKRQGAAAEMKTRVAVLKRMQTLSELLGNDYRISVFDAFRTIATQAELFDEFGKMISEENPSWNDEQIKERTLQFVADPESKPHPPAHNTGGAIDLSLIYKNEPADFGTVIDEISDWSQTNYFETHTSEELEMDESRFQTIRRNRRILFNGMKSLGFINLPSEWWHYDIGNAHWAGVVKSQVIFGSIEF